MAVKKTARLAAKAAPTLTRYSKAEYIKVAPLHFPKPVMSIAELSKAKQEPSDSELFDGATPAAPPSAGRPQPAPERSVATGSS